MLDQSNKSKMQSDLISKNKGNDPKKVKHF